MPWFRRPRQRQLSQPGRRRLAIRQRARTDPANHYQGPAWHDAALEVVDQAGRGRRYRSVRAFSVGPGQRSAARGAGQTRFRSEEHTSELQSLMRISYAVFCLKKKKNKYKNTNNNIYKTIN